MVAKGELMGDPGPRRVRRGGEDLFKRRERMKRDRRSGLKCDEILDFKIFGLYERRIQC
jgi:hypothetical protein